MDAIQHGTALPSNRHVVRPLTLLGLIAAIALLIQYPGQLAPSVVTAAAATPVVQTITLVQHPVNLLFDSQGEENAGGDVKILDTRTGVVLGSILLGHFPSASLFDKLRSRMFIAATTALGVNDGAVSAVAGSTGAIVQRFPLAGPSALAEDPLTGRLFVLNQQPLFEPPGPSTLLVFSPSFSR